MTPTTEVVSADYDSYNSGRECGLVSEDLRQGDVCSVWSLLGLMEYIEVRLVCCCGEYSCR